MTPKHPVGPAFDHAADRAAAWRKQQEKLLSSEQRKEYDRMQREQNAKLRAHEETFQERLPDLFAEEKRRLLLHKPEPALRMLPGRPLKERRAEQLARGNVQARHEAERIGMEERFQQERDGYLHTAEISRQKEARGKTAPDLSAALRARAANKERTRGEEGRELGR
jgi:hypothetical protein